ncbi:stage III sporulation protein AG [Brockia lithotrophica]|uniref:Stage III sporulation protein AG n=1 Tax=Brockia lithotrophica TaxID=933949 RepID=A0A660L7D1_9BACL|nr:stage III sporulation protein AG [Brockia lithotrophica]RKQ88742.1 stage III sporulation protein AG [Brockia lithotrophica]
MSHFRLPEWSALPSGTRHRIFLLALVVLVLLGVHFATPAPRPSPPVPPAEDVRKDTPPSDSGGAASPAFHRYEAEYEKRITALLEEVLGPGNVRVFVTVDSSEETVWETHVRSTRTAVEERDAQGGTRTTGEETREEEPVSLRSGDRETPIMRKVLQPRIRGVVVVVRGAEDARVKLWIVEAVGRAFDVPAHRIAVVPMRGTNP